MLQGSFYKFANKWMNEINIKWILRIILKYVSLSQTSIYFKMYACTVWKEIGMISFTVWASHFIFSAVFYLIYSVDKISCLLIVTTLSYVCSRV